MTDPEAQASQLMATSAKNLAAARNPLKSSTLELRDHDEPKPPIVAGALLTDAEMTFLEFLDDPVSRSLCELLFGGGATSASTALDGLRKAVRHHYFGHVKGSRKKKKKGSNELKGDEPGLLTEDAAATRKALKQYAAGAYRGDPEKRGVLFWQRVAGLLWEAYRDLLDLRKRAMKITRQEVTRIERLPQQRARRAKYMRKYRKKRNDDKRAELAPYFKAETKKEWRETRSKRKAPTRRLIKQNRGGR